MSRAERAAVASGAKPRTEYPPYGDQALRRKWTERLCEVTDLATALDLLVDWRQGRGASSLEDEDFLWVEARIEDRVAVLRFAALSEEEIDSIALTGEPITATCQAALTQAKDAANVDVLEAVVAEFRRRYKPPVMPTVPFMRTEIELVELLIKRRSLDWYDEPLEELRRRRAAVVADGDPASA